MLKLSFLNLFRRKSRTALALVGIVIGLTAIIGLVSIVDGALHDVTSVISNIQFVMVYEKDALEETLSAIPLDYESKLERIRGVRTVVPEVWVVPASVEGKAPVNPMGTAVLGVDIMKFNALRSSWIGPIERGQKLLPSDKKKVAIGKQLAEDYDKFVGSNIEINGQDFKVKGIFSTESEFLGSFILMKESEAREISSLASDKVNDFFIELENPEKDAEIAQLIEFKFDDVTASTASKFSEQISSVIGNFRLAVFLIAALAAFVAGIGIINTMLMSVMERKQEIGALRAVGWTSFNVMKMVLYESLMLGFLGALIGLAVGFSAAKLIESQLGVMALISPELIIESFSFALILGVSAGLYPAYRASKLNPVDALAG